MGLSPRCTGRSRHFTVDQRPLSTSQTGLEYCSVMCSPFQPHIPVVTVLVAACVHIDFFEIPSDTRVKPKRGYLLGADGPQPDSLSCHRLTVSTPKAAWPHGCIFLPNPEILSSHTSLGIVPNGRVAHGPWKMEGRGANETTPAARIASWMVDLTKEN